MFRNLKSIQSSTNTLGLVGTWFANRRAIHALSKVDDRVLRDMGLSRSEIHSAVRGRRETLTRI